MLRDKYNCGISQFLNLGSVCDCTGIYWLVRIVHCHWLMLMVMIVIPKDQLFSSTYILLSYTSYGSIPYWNTLFFFFFFPAMPVSFQVIQFA